MGRALEFRGASLLMDELISFGCDVVNIMVCEAIFFDRSFYTDVSFRCVCAFSGFRCGLLLFLSCLAVFCCGWFAMRSVN